MSDNKIKVGFTLIELLIVMAILGILAVIVLVAINPQEQFSRANDAGRITSVNQLGHQIQVYYTANDASYPDEADWDNTLASSNNLGAFPSGIEYISANGVTACDTNAKPGSLPTFCYALDSSGNNYGAIVFAKLEAQSQRNKCVAPGETPYFVYHTTDGRGGVICSSSDLSPWQPGTANYLQ